MGWREHFAEKLLSLDEAADRIPADSIVLASMGVGVPYALLDAATKRSEGFTLYIGNVASPTKAFLPPFNQKIEVKNFFFGPVERASAKFRPRLSYQAMHLSDMSYDREHIHRAEVVLIQAAPPDENGMLSQGACPLSVSAIAPGALVICQINDRVPYVPGDGVMLPAERVDWFTETSAALYPLMPSEPSEQEVAIAGHIVERVPDGACIQLGIGSIATAVGGFLREKKHLGIHSEMFVEPMVDLIECGTVDNSRKTLMPGKTVFGFAAGTQRMYDFLDAARDIEARPFAWVNDPRVIGQNDNVVSINSALEIDLTGQVCAESIGQTQFSGTGGQLDFVRGARWSKGGQSFIAMGSSRVDKAGVRHSKISLTLPLGSAVTTPRADVQYIVTEYGCIDLRNRPLDERARLLISIAHPDFRDELTESAKKAGLIL